MQLQIGDPAWNGAEPATGSAATVALTSVEAILSSLATGQLGTNGHGHELRPPLPVIHLHGVQLNAIDESRAINYILDELDAGFGGFVITPNLDHLRRYIGDMSSGAMVAAADLVMADGMP